MCREWWLWYKKWNACQREQCALQSKEYFRHLSSETSRETSILWFGALLGCHSCELRKIKIFRVKRRWNQQHKSVSHKFFTIQDESIYRYFIAHLPRKLFGVANSLSLGIWDCRHHITLYSRDPPRFEHRTLASISEGSEPLDSSFPTTGLFLLYP